MTEAELVAKAKSGEPEMAPAEVDHEGDADTSPVTQTATEDAPAAGSGFTPAEDAAIAAAQEGTVPTPPPPSDAATLEDAADLAELVDGLTHDLEMFAKDANERTAACVADDRARLLAPNVPDDAALAGVGLPAGGAEADALAWRQDVVKVAQSLRAEFEALDAAKARVLGALDAAVARRVNLAQFVTLPRAAKRAKAAKA